VSRNKLIVESSVACKVGTPILPLPDWTAVVQHLAPQFDFVVSPLSFLEVLNSLACGEEKYVIPNLKRLEALSPTAPLSPVFLEMPGQFILREVLARGPLVKDTYQPEEMAEAMAVVLRHKSVSTELRDWLAEIKSNHQSGTTNYVDSHDEMRKVGQVVPSRELWLKAKLRHLGVLQLSDDEVQKLSVALDAAYEYAAWLRNELKNPSYLPSKEKSAWVDYQQLFYLCDPAVHILYVDSDFTQRSGGSSQKSRLIKFADVLAESMPTSA
jgi:hypothetical protein